jgi:GntR family transcriptional regulator
MWGACNPVGIKTDSAVPKYQQLLELLRSRVRRGELAPGDRLPSEAGLGEIYGVSRITVRQALAELEREGLLDRVPGKGTFVRRPEGRVERLTRLSGFGENVDAFGFKAGYHTHQAGEGQVPADVADRLRGPGRRAYVVERSLLANGRPVGFHVSYLPLWLVERCGPELFSREALDESSLYGTIERCGVSLYRAEEVVEPGLTDTREAERLRMEEGELVLRVRRTVYDVEERPIEFVLISYRSDSYTFRLDLYRGHGF